MVSKFFSFLGKHAHIAVIAAVVLLLVCGYAWLSPSFDGVTQPPSSDEPPPSPTASPSYRIGDAWNKSIGRLTMRIGSPTQLFLYDQDGRAIQDATWHTSNYHLAAVNPTGNVVPTDRGNGKITAKLGGKAVISVVFDIEPEPAKYGGKVAKPLFVRAADGVLVNAQSQPGATATLAIVGDLMCFGTQQRKAYSKKTEKYNFDGSFAQTKNILQSADFAIGNLETALSESAPLCRYVNKKYGFPYINGPAVFVHSLQAAGFDAVFAANNHMADCEERGIDETLDALDRAKMPNVGLYRGGDDPRFLLADVNGIKVGFVAYSSVFNGSLDLNLSRDAIDNKMSVFSAEAATRDIAAARAAGAEFVVAYDHEGGLYQKSIAEKHKNVVGSLADAGADYITICHSHVVSAYDTVTSKDGRVVPVWYGMGNFVSSMNNSARNTNSIIVWLELTRGTDGTVSVSDSYIPVKILSKVGSDWWVPTPALPELIGKGVSDAQKELLAKAREEIREDVGSKTQERQP